MENAQAIKEKYMNDDKKYELIEFDLSYNIKMSLGKFLSINDAINKAKEDYDNFLFQSFGRNKNSTYKLYEGEEVVFEFDSDGIRRMLNEDKQKNKEHSNKDKKEKTFER